MSLYDRDYTQENYHAEHRYAPQMRMRFPSLTPVVKYLLIGNFALYFIGELFFPRNIPIGAEKINLLEQWFSVFPYSVGAALQVWRLITYQFLHGSVWHVGMNMLWLFFLGPTLERHWGSKRFLMFYLMCGVAGALFYMFLVGVKFLPAGPMVGASGAILGVLAACAILFPQISIFLFPLPMAIPIRVAAVAGTLLYLFFVVTRSDNAGGHAAHLAGMAAGAIYVFSGPLREKLRARTRSGSWEKRIATERELQMEVDRLLQKIHDYGIHSLTPK
ncbi:MAG: rhomboid family intramembrane serine protease, partial [Planctomycetota bacterium]